MPEARRLKSGKWRLYQTPDLYPIRDPANGTILAFQSLTEARQWWSDRHPQGPGLEEAIKCARCGAYFGPGSGWTTYGGQYYHPSHTPQAVEPQRRR